jgi:hypothetical protein
MTKLAGWARQAAFVLSAMVVSAGASAQVTWTTHNDQVTGAKNVSVGGSFYDVSFGDTYVPIPSFVDFNFAQLASQALVDQVFVSGAPLSLDANPYVIAGCMLDHGFPCQVHTVYADIAMSRRETRTYAGINVAGTTDDVTMNFSYSGWPLVVGDSPIRTLAYWSVSPVTAVPEPETYALMLAGIGLMGAVARPRKAKQA